MSKYLFCYDITDAKRLRMIAKTLTKNGYRIQKSFFISDKSEIEVATIALSLVLNMDIKKDKLAVFKFCEKCFANAIFLGDQAPEWFFNDYMVL